MSFVKMFLATTASIATVSAGLLYKYQQKLIYPTQLTELEIPHDTPDQYGIPYDDLYLATSDGIKIHGFACLQPKEKQLGKTVLILNPNAGNIGLALPIVNVFYKMGLNVVLFDYRGYGTSQGEPSEIGLKKDADTMLQYITDHAILSKTELVLYGRSLGGAVAIYIASQNNPLIKKIILENTFLSIRKTIPHIFPFLKHVVWLCHQIWDSEALIQTIDINVKALFLSAELDEVVPPSHMSTLYELAGDREKKFVLFEGAHHNDTTLYPGYWDVVGDFLDKE